MSDYDSIIQNMNSIAPARAITSIDDNPDDGARALQLSRATGVAPEAIYGDLDGFEKEHKASLTSQLVRGNSHIAQYIRSNSLADVVSNDDYGNLDNFSKKASWLSDFNKAIAVPGSQAIGEGIRAGVAGVGEGFARDPFPADWDKYKTNLGWQLLGIPLRGLNAFVGGLSEGAGGFASEATLGITGDKGLAESAKREAQGMVESELGRGGSGLHPEAGAGRSIRAQEALVAAKPWLENGLEPPRGVHPMIDEAKAELNETYVKGLADVMAEAQKSLTKDRDPELFKKFVDQHFAEGSIGISGDRIAELYGDKIPSPDDNLLGWVPNMAQKLEAARATGDDIHIPLSDWVTNVDPKLARELHDDLRAWPGGITKNEAKEPIEPKSVVDSPLAQVRDAAGLEPAFSMGDRKIQLKQIEHQYDPSWHEYHMLDQNGKVVGELSILPDAAKKQLYIGNISGLAGLYSNSFGPSLMRDLFKRQLKELYPDFETVTGHRVSGAREVSGVTEDLTKAMPVIKLSPSDPYGIAFDHNRMHEILESAYQQSFVHGVEANIVPRITYTKNETALIAAVRDELAAIVPTADFVPTAGIRHSAIGSAEGVYIQQDLPKILVDMLQADSIGTARHEAIHHLYRSGLFEQGEWDALQKASRDEDWIGRYNVRDRWSWLDEEGQHEEAIAEAYRDWASNKDTVVHPETPVASAFQKIWEFLQRIKQRFAEILGKEPNANELFEKVHSGEIGHRGLEGKTDYREAAFSRELQPANDDRFTGRGGIENDIRILKDQLRFREQLLSGEIDPGQYQSEAAKYYAATTKQNAVQQIAEIQGQLAKREQDLARYKGPAFSISDHLDNLRAETAGLDKKSFQRIQDLIEQRHTEDVEAATKRAEKEQRRTQTKEWKSNYADVRKEVETSIRQRPDVAADLLVGSGELQGQKLKQRYSLAADDLTAEQKAALPRHYYSKEGLPVDGVARLTGFTSGDAMMEKLVEYNQNKGKLTSQEMLRQTIDDETKRQMEAKYGKLEDNIMSEAQDQALSETNLNVLAEEWQGAAMAAGVSAVDKEFAKSEALRMFGNMKVGDIDVDRLMANIGRHGRDAERALLAQKPAEALVAMQRKYMTALIAAEAKKLVKEQVTFDRTAKQFAKREVSNVDPEYTNYIHDILQRVGKPVHRSIQDIAQDIEGRGTGTLEEFVAAKQGSLRELPVWDRLYDPNFRKEVSELSADEFRAVHNSIKALVFNGRDELKIYKQGEAQDLAEVKAELISNVEKNVGKEIAYDVKGNRATGIMRGRLGKYPLSYLAQHVQIENALNRWDGFNSKGAWNQFVMRDLIDGANQVDAWKKEYAAKIKALTSPENMGKTIDNVLFRDPNSDLPFKFTKKNLLTVMLNTGTQSNLVKLAKGYGLEPQQVLDWVHQHATKEDWDFVQGMWGMFSDIKAKSDTMYRSLTGGVPAENIPAIPIETKFGTYDGGYYPVMYHPEFEGKSKAMMGRDPLEQENYVRATTPAGYTKSRTNYVAPMSLDLDMLPGRISQMLHDIGLRPAVLNAAKVFYDKDIRSAIMKNAGAEYKDELIPYLRGVANASNYTSKAESLFTTASEFFRQNMISTLVGLNPGTVMKHGPTAAMLSIREVGGLPFLKAVQSMFSINEATGESNWQFAKQNSLELQRRDRNWQETLYGATGSLTPGEKFGTLRQKIMELSSKPVAMSDMLSAVPTWLAKYEEESANGATHGDAVYEADRAVRRAHGSTAITNRTAIMRNTSPWLTSVYNFFSDVMNRQMETLWKAGDTMDMVKEGNYKAAMAAVPGLTASAFAYVLWPAIVENAVAPAPPNQKPDESWAHKAAHSIAFSLSSSWVGVRDVANAMLSGRDPQLGLIGSFYQEITNLYRDAHKDSPFARDHAGKLIADGSSFVGAMTGLLPAQVGKTARFAYDVDKNVEHPHGPWAWLTGLRFGTTKGHSTTFDNYMKGINR